MILKYISINPSLLTGSVLLNASSDVNLIRSMFIFIIINKIIYNIVMRKLIGKFKRIIY